MKKLVKIGLGIGGTLLAVCALVFSNIYFFSVMSRGIVPTDKDLENHTPYSRVCIFGLDGAGGFMKDYECNEFHEIFDKGSIKYNVKTQHLTDSAPNWFSIFHGVNYLKHHLGNSTSEKAKEYFSEYPSIFKVFSEKYPEKHAYSIVNWGTINSDLLEDVPNLTKVYAEGDSEVGKDVFVKDKVIETISSEDVGIMYMHFDQIDGEGHAHGNGSNEYKNAIKTVSGYIGEVYKKYEELGYADDTLFVAVSDHGISPNGHHGTFIPSVRNSMLAVYGKHGDVIQGTPSFVVNQDVASVVLYGLGIKQPDSYNGSVPKGMFNILK